MNAHETSRRRDEFTEQLIADARAPATEAELDAQLSDEALRATPAVREIGAPVESKPHHADCAADINHSGMCTRADGTVILVRRADAWSPLPRDAIVLTGADAARYRAVQAASVAALDAQQRAATASKDLRDAIQTMCAALAPAKEG